MGFAKTIVLMHSKFFKAYFSKDLHLEITTFKYDWFFAPKWQKERCH